MLNSENQQRLDILYLYVSLFTFLVAMNYNQEREGQYAGNSKPEEDYFRFEDYQQVRFCAIICLTNTINDGGRRGFCYRLFYILSLDTLRRPS